MNKRIFIVLPAVCLLGAAFFRYHSASENKNASARFHHLTNSLFQNEITSSTLALHYTLEHPEHYGIFHYPVTYGDSSEHNFDATQCKKELYTIPQKALSLPDQITFDILSLSLENISEEGIFSLYQEPLGPTLGIQAQLPILLCEYPFQTIQDIENYLELLSQTDTYFTRLLEHEISRSRAGLFMTDQTADMIIQQCRSFAETNALKTHMLITIFNDKIDAFPYLTPKEKASYKARDLDLVKTHVLPAYLQLANGLHTLKGSCKNPYGLCYLPSGKAYYELLLRSSIGTWLPVPAIERRIQKQLAEDLQKARTLLLEYPDLPVFSSSFSFGTPEEILTELQTRMSDDFPEPPHAAFSVKYVHPSLEDYLSPAFYLTPPIDHPQQNVIYINRASVCSPLELYTTLAHEGYPGHLYQNLCSSQTLSPVRSLFSFGGYTEGWATYVEMESFRYAADHLCALSKTSDSDLDVLAASVQFARLNRSVMLGLSSLLDICIHYHGYTPKETAVFLTQLGFPSDSVTGIYNAILEAPANYLRYYLGYLSFLDLRTYCQEHWPDSFYLKDFHKQILTIGPAPFPVLEKYLKQYYSASAQPPALLP